MTSGISRLRYAGEHHGFKLALQPATTRLRPATFPTGIWRLKLGDSGIDRNDSQYFQVGAYAQHVATGLFLLVTTATSSMKGTGRSTTSATRDLVRQGRYPREVEPPRCDDPLRRVRPANDDVFVSRSRHLFEFKGGALASCRKSTRLPCRSGSVSSTSSADDSRRR